MSVLWACERQGSVFVDGQMKVGNKNNVFVEEAGGILTMEVDLNELKITFVNKRNNAIFNYAIGQHFKQQPVYVFVTMSTKGASVEIVP